jgi:hypothetical protein
VLEGIDPSSEPSEAKTNEFAPSARGRSDWSEQLESRYLAAP